MAKQQEQDFEKVTDDGDQTVAQFEDKHKSFLDRVQGFLHSYPTTVPLIILILSIIAFIIIDPRFASLYNANVIMQRVSIIGMLAMGQTLIILTAGIDLSIGAVMIFTSMLLGTAAVNWGVPAGIAIPISIIAGGLAGWINGLLVTIIKLPPFIATLGTWRVFFALIFIIFGSQSIRSSDIDELAPSLKLWGNSVNIGPIEISLGSLLFIFMGAVIWYALMRTAWGRHVYAVGDDPEAAELAGIQSKRVLRSVYIVAGLLAGLAGWMVIGRFGSASPSAYAEANLESITAVVIGGISLFGGRGSVVGVIFGALIVQVFDAGLGFTDLDSQAKYLALGLLIIIAVALDQWIRKVSA